MYHYLNFTFTCIYFSHSCLYNNINRHSHVARVRPHNTAQHNTHTSLWCFYDTTAFRPDAGGGQKHILEAVRSFDHVYINCMLGVLLFPLSVDRIMLG